MSLVILQKPVMGQPCNRCGLCCTRELCSFAMDEIHPGHGPWVSWRVAEEWRGPCPFLEREGNGPETRCGLLIRKPEIFDPLAIGKGCFAPD